MLKILLRLNFMSMRRWFVRNENGSKKSSAAAAGKLLLYVLLFAYVIGFFFYMFYQTFDAMAETMKLMGLDWVYFLIAFVMALMLMVMFNTFTAKSQLFEAKDNELLLSMPIPPYAILTSRMLSLIALNLGFELLVLLPAAIVWYGKIELTTAGLVSFILIALLLPLAAFSVSAIFGWILSLISSRLRNKVLFETVISIAFLGLYLYFCTMLSSLPSYLLDVSSSVAGGFSDSILYWFGIVPVTGKPVYTLLCCLLLLAPFIIVYIILAATFIHTATSKRSGKKRAYKSRTAKLKSTKSALLGRELSRFFSSSSYIMNAGLGSLFLLVAGIFLIIKGKSVAGFLSMLPGFGTYALPIAAMSVGFMAGISAPANSSVSLEGKSLYVIRSLPVATADVLKAKLRCSLLIYLPSVILCMAALCWVCQAELIINVLTLITVFALLLFIHEAALCSNLNHPLLDWQTEAEPIKRGAAVINSMLINFGILAAMGISAYFLLRRGFEIQQLLAIYAGVLVAADLLLYRWIMTRGVRKFERI